MKQRVEMLKAQEEKLRKDANQYKKAEENRKKIIEEKNENKKYMQKYLTEKNNKIENQRELIKKKYKEERDTIKKLKDVNDPNNPICAKNKKEYVNLVNEQAHLIKVRTIQDEENLNKKKDRVSNIRSKIEKNDMNSEITNSKLKSSHVDRSGLIHFTLSVEQKANYELSKEIIEELKKDYSELMKEEQTYLKKIKETQEKIQTSKNENNLRFLKTIGGFPKKNVIGMKERAKSSAKLKTKFRSEKIANITVENKK